jgi:hypothetical protein
VKEFCSLIFYEQLSISEAFQNNSEYYIILRNGDCFFLNFVKLNVGDLLRSVCDEFLFCGSEMFIIISIFDIKSLSWRRGHSTSMDVSHACCAWTIGQLAGMGG